MIKIDIQNNEGIISIYGSIHPSTNGGDLKFIKCEFIKNDGSKKLLYYKGFEKVTEEELASNKPKGYDYLI